MKKTIVILVVIVLVIIGIFYAFKSPSEPIDEGTVATTTDTTDTQVVSTSTTTQTDKSFSVIGKSVEGRDITAYHFGTGTKELLFIGGVHGGYEWNTVLVAQELADYLKANPTAVPANVKVTVIPVLNPDGLNKVVGTSTGNFTVSDVPSSQTTVVSGRFNANKVDLNRNFDCDWQTTGKWQNVSVSGGSAAFSEPESIAIKNYVEANDPTAVVVWYSAAGGVFASNCHNGVSTETEALTKAYAKASGYTAHQSFDFYSTTGDMTNWLAKISIPTISVLLTNHTDIEWSKNKAGVTALLEYYSK